MTATTIAHVEDPTTTIHSNEFEETEKRIRIRSYEPRDHAAVLDIVVPGLLSYASIPGQEQQFWDDYIAKSLKGDLADIEGTYFAPGGHFWVAVVDHDDGRDEVVGTVALERKSTHDGELRRMSVKSEYRRYGVGRRLVQNLEMWAQDQGVTRVWLAVGYVLERAHRFYESLGFAVFQDKVLCEDPLFVEACFEKRLVAATTQ